jgi:shikimate kinase
VTTDKIYLGFMASGKSTVGRAPRPASAGAEDVTLIERRERDREIFASQGEPAFGRSSGKSCSSCTLRHAVVAHGRHASTRRAAPSSTDGVRLDYVPLG